MQNQDVLVSPPFPNLSEAKPQLAEAVAALHELTIGDVDEYESYDSLEVGCLSCSGVKRQLPGPTPK